MSGRKKVSRKKNNFVTALLDASKSWKGLYRSVNIANYPPKLQYRSEILSIHNSMWTSTQLYAKNRRSQYANVLKCTGTRFWCKRGFRNETYSLFTWSKQKWLFRRSIRAFLKLFRLFWSKQKWLFFQPIRAFLKLFRLFWLAG